MRWVAGILVLLVGALPGEAQVPPGKQKLPNYYPMKPGTKWTYQIDAGNGKKVELSNQIAKTETIDGQVLARLETVLNGNVVATEHLNSTRAGVFRCRINGVEVTPPVCILKYPVKEGASWEAEGKVGPQDLKMKLVSGKFEEVTTPAGKYKAVLVDSETKVNGVAIKSKCWFAPDLGIIKQKTEIGDKIILLDLVKFEAGK